jgi:hypothetical protein
MDLKQAYLFDVKNPSGEFLADKTIWTLLKQDPYLEYGVENEQVYVISNGTGYSLVIPKDRNSPQAYRPRSQRPLDKAFVLLGWAFLGWALAGLGTLIFAPLAIIQALRTYQGGPVSRADHIRVAIVIVLAGLSLIGALGLTYLFYLHF